MPSFSVFVFQGETIEVLENIIEEIEIYLDVDETQIEAEIKEKRPPQSLCALL